MPIFGELKTSTLDTYAYQMFFAYPAGPILSILALRNRKKPECWSAFSIGGLVPQGAEANLDQLTTASTGISPERLFTRARCGRYCPQGNSGSPYGRSKNPDEWEYLLFAD